MQLASAASQCDRRSAVSYNSLVLANLAVIQEMLARVRDANAEVRGRNGGSPGVNPPDNEELFASFRELARVVAEAERDAPLDEIADDLDAIERHVAQKEREYVALIEAAVKAPMMRALSLYGGTMSAERMITAIIPIAQISSVTFALRDAVVEEVCAKGGGHSQHANTVWDEEIVASTSLSSTIRGKFVVLVTSDTDL